MGIQVCTYTYNRMSETRPRLTMTKGSKSVIIYDSNKK